MAYLKPFSSTIAPATMASVIASRRRPAAWNHRTATPENTLSPRSSRQSHAPCQERHKVGCPSVNTRSDKVVQSRNIEAAAATIVTGQVLRIDVGEVNGRIFLNNSSIGVYPWIVRERQKDEGKGYGKWGAFGWGVISILHRYSLLHVHLRVDDQEELISIWRTGCSRISHCDQQADAEPRIARHGLAQAVGPPPASRPRHRGEPIPLKK
jgi:hypothetical protein